MKDKLKKLIEKRKALLAKIDAILSAAEKENRALTAEQETERAGSMTELRNLDTQITSTEELIAAQDRQETLDKRNLPASPTAPADTTVEKLSKQDRKDLSKFSYVRALNAALEGRAQSGLELEMHQEAEKELRDAGVVRNGGNLLIPQVVLSQAGGLGSFERRDLTATGQTTNPGDQGGLTIATQLGSLIDRLRTKLILSQMGVTMLGGLQGNIAFPKVTGDDQATEKAETAVANESSPTFSQISLAPRRLPVFAEISRQLLLQNSPDVEAWLRNDLAYQVGKVMNQRAINGSGSSNQPTGILNTVGVGAIAMGTNGAVPTWDTIVDLETLIASIDADVDNMGYLTNPKVRGKLKKTQVFSGTNGEPIWSRTSPGTPLNDYRALVSNFVPSNLTKGTANAICSAMIFGNFADALMGQWGGLEFLINPYSKDTEGLIRINCWTFYDFLVRRAESFAVVKDILTT